MTGARIAVVGVGAIGGAIGADLADLGRYDITLCARAPFGSLVVHHPEGESRAEARVETDPARVSPVDWVLLATKAHQSVDARPWLDALCGDETRIAVLQNGVDHVEHIAPLISNSTSIVPVVIQISAERAAPGRVRQSHRGLLFVPDDEGGHAFAGLFDGGRTTVKPTSDFASQAWWKLLSNAALGAVCALTIRENAVARDPEVRETVLALMREVAAVGRAEGGRLPEDAPEKVLNRILEAAPDHWSSITVDRRKGRPMEWRARNEVVGRLGRRHGIATPLNDLMTTLLRVSDAREVR